VSARLHLVRLAILSLGLVAASPRAPAGERDSVPTAAAARVVGYMASWGVRTKGASVAALPARQLTHIFYAFALIGTDGSVTLGDRCLDVGACGPEAELPAHPLGNFGELKLLKARNPRLKLAISVGGWGGSARFSDAALTDSTRRRFSESAIDLFIRRWPGLFDGIDIDWEFPVQGGMKGNVERPADKENFTLLLSELRRELDAQGQKDNRHYELTIAASARPSEIANLELGRIVPLLDFINVMTYDYHTGGSIAHFNAPLYAATNDPTPELNADASMRAFQAGIVPSDKLLVGIPFFSRAYGGVPNVNAGLFQPSNGPPKDWKGQDGDWRQLARTRIRDQHYERHWEPAARVPWLYDPRSGTWITYDDPQSVRAKVDYVRERGLGGVVIWELFGDDGSLMRAIGKAR
jgi:chitinase